MRRTALFLTTISLAGSACGDSTTKPGDTRGADATDATDSTGVPDTGPTDSADTAVEILPDTAVDSAEPDGLDGADGEVASGELALAKGDRCDDLTTVAAATLPYSDLGDTTLASDDYIYTTGAACGGPAGQGTWGDASADMVYAFTPALSGTYRITLTPDGGFDPGLMVTDACPPIGEDGFAALTCLGVSDQGEGAPEVLRVSLLAGKTYFVLVDGWSNDTAVAGTFALSIALGEDCQDQVDNDGNALVDCADPQCSGDPRCDEAGYPEGCSNDKDDDSDGKTDCADSDCDGVAVCDEAALAGACQNAIDDEGDGKTDCADPDCADDQACDESTYEAGCDNGSDDDGDGKTDCADPDCGRAPGCLAAGETCATAVALELAVPAQGTTLGRVSDYATLASTCNISTSSVNDGFGAAAPDAAFLFTPPTPGRYLFRTASDFDDALTVTSDCAFAVGFCFGMERRGTGGEQLVVELLTTDPVYVLVDGWSNSNESNAGDFTLTVQRVTATNIESDCTDGLDSDSDGDTDCADSDCAFDRSACIEAGHCDDARDNDNDGNTDCADSDCQSDLVACPPPPGDTCATPATVSAIDTELSIDTCEFAANYLFAPDAGCLVPTYDSPDAVIGFTAPAAGTYAVEVEPDFFDAILNVIIDDTCPAEAVTACDASDDGSFAARASFTLAAGETAWFLVSAYGDDFFEESECGEALVTVFAVDPETCNDSLDNDRDGKIDCADADCAEDALCNEALNGAGACSDALDNDGDGITDCYDIDCAGTTACPDGIPGDGCASPIAALGEAWALTLDTCGYTNDFTTTDANGCQATAPSARPKDFVVSFTAPTTGAYRVVLDPGVPGAGNYDALLNIVKAATCPASPLDVCAASADSITSVATTVTATAGDTFWIVGGGADSGCGPSRISISLLEPEVCDDTVDNDGDGDADCDDSDCDVEPFCNEAQNGAGACGDQLDNDQDGMTDCYDGDCKASALCPNGAIGDTCAGAVSIDTLPSSADFDTCDYTSDYAQSSTGGCKTMGSAGDVTAHFVAPEDGDYRVSFTTGLGGSSTFDSVLNVVKGDVCPSAPIAACWAGVDDAVAAPTEALTLTALAGESFWILADGYGAGCGIANLAVVRLTDELCDDEVDNDGDGLIDCADPDCKASEPLLCPTPAGETCSDTAIEVLSLPFSDATRSTCDFAQDYTADGDTCQDYSGSEVIYRYTATAPATLEVTLQALGEPTDMVLSARLGCPDTIVLDQCIASEDAHSVALAEVMQVAVEAGETLYIFAAPYFSSRCTGYELEVHELP